MRLQAQFLTLSIALGKLSHPTEPNSPIPLNNEFTIPFSK